MMLDLDCRFDIHRLVGVLQLRIHEALGMYLIVLSFVSVDFMTRVRTLSAVQQGTMCELECSSKETGDVLRSCLKRFIYMRCYNTYDFLVALKVDGLYVLNRLF